MRALGIVLTIAFLASIIEAIELLESEKHANGLEESFKAVFAESESTAKPHSKALDFALKKEKEETALELKEFKEPA